MTAKRETILQLRKLSLAYDFIHIKAVLIYLNNKKYLHCKCSVNLGHKLNGLCQIYQNIYKIGGFKLLNTYKLSK